MSFIPRRIFFDHFRIFFSTRRRTLEGRTTCRLLLLLHTFFVSIHYRAHCYGDQGPTKIGCAARKSGRDLKEEKKRQTHSKVTHDCNVDKYHAGKYKLCERVRKI